MNNMELSCTQGLYLALECSCCGQLRNLEDQEEALIKMKLFGAEKYAICIVCSQEVGKPYGKRYIKKWDKWYEKLRKKNEP